MANGAGPSESFLSSYFSNPFKKKKEKGDIRLKNETNPEKDIEYDAKKRTGAFNVTSIFGRKKEK